VLLFWKIGETKQLELLPRRPNILMTKTRHKIRMSND